MAEYTCPGCAANPEIFPDCWHSPDEWALAEAMRDAVERLHPEPNPQSWERGSIEGAWNFIQDAEGLPAEVGPAPYEVTMIHADKSDFAAVGVVNGRHLFGVSDGEGDSYAQYLGDLGGFLTVTNIGPQNGQSQGSSAVEPKA